MKCGSCNKVDIGQALRGMENIQTMEKNVLHEKHMFKKTFVNLYSR